MQTFDLTGSEAAFVYKLCIKLAINDGKIAITLQINLEKLLMRFLKPHVKKVFQRQGSAVVSIFQSRKVG